MTEIDSLLDHQDTWWHHYFLAPTKRDTSCQVITHISTYLPIHPFSISFHKGSEVLRRMHNRIKFQTQKQRTKTMSFRIGDWDQKEKSWTIEATWTHTVKMFNWKCAPGFHARWNKNGNIISYMIHMVFKEEIRQITRGRTDDYRILCMADETT